MSEKKQSGWGGVGVILILVFTKSAKLMKAAKVAKPIITFGTMALSAFAYAFWLGPWFAIGLVGMLFIHEMGHVIALRLKGYPASTPVFIPFLGAAIFAPKFKERDGEAYVGYGGPLLGTLGALALFATWFFLPKDSTVAHLVLITSYAAIYLNLFNMIPISPLDGGRITQAAGSWFQYVGVIVLATITFFFREPVILYVWVIVLTEIHFIKPKPKAMLAMLCTILMATLMYLGYSSQPLWVDIVDIVIATLFSIMMTTDAWSGAETLGKDTRPELPAASRLMWFGLYAALTIFLVVVLLYQHSLLPEAALK